MAPVSFAGSEPLAHKRDTIGTNHPSMTERQKSAGRPAPKPQKPRPTDSAFDVWLNRGLHQLFDDVAKEPVPDTLLNLIQGIAEPGDKKMAEKKAGETKTVDSKISDKKK